MFNHNPLLFLAVSWDPRTNNTYAFLHCVADSHREYLSRIKRFVSANPQLATNPVLLPLLIMDLETDSTLADEEGWVSELKQIESETKQSSVHTEAFDPVDLDLTSIVQKLNGCIGFVTKIERESEAVLLHLHQAHEAISDLQTVSPRLEEVSRVLMKYVDFQIESRKNLFLRLQNLRRRSQLQLDFVRCPSQISYFVELIYPVDLQHSSSRCPSTENKRH